MSSHLGQYKSWDLYEVVLSWKPLSTSHPKMFILISFIIVQKEVSHLRGLLNGGAANQDTDPLPLGLFGSPGPFKWEVLNGTCSPLTSDKRLSQVCFIIDCSALIMDFALSFLWQLYFIAQKKEYEAALVAALRREKEKEMALQALTAESQAAKHLVCYEQCHLSLHQSAISIYIVILWKRYSVASLWVSVPIKWCCLLFNPLLSVIRANRNMHLVRSIV